MPSTSRQRDRDSVGEIERWRERERDRERDGMGQGNSERSRLYDPKQLCAAKYIPSSHLFSGSDAELLHREMGGVRAGPLTRVDIGHSLTNRMWWE